MLDWLTGKPARQRGWFASLFARPEASPLAPVSITPRKLRLFACACCAPIRELLAYPESRDAVEVAEQFADGIKSESDLADVHREALSASSAFQDTLVAPAIMGSMPNVRAQVWAARAGAATTLADAEEAAGQTSQAVVRVAEEIASWDAQWAARAARTWARAALLRHIVGDPFEPATAPAHLPSAVMQLADALYHGNEVAPALHDALLDAGCPDLAAHFRAEAWHPKGCWALDLILGKS
jgi:hypothetical protein